MSDSRIVPGPSIRPPLPPKLIRLSAALLEAGLLVCVGVMFLDGAIQNPDTEGPSRLPIPVGFSVVPILVVTLIYAVQRVIRPRRFAFMIAGALVCALGAALRAGLEPSERLLDALRGSAVGAVAMGFLMSVDENSAVLLEGGARPGPELGMGILLVTFGAMPSAIRGGFILAIPTILLGLVILIRCVLYDAPLVVPRRSLGLALRIFITMLFGLLALGFIIVCPMISLGMMRMR